MLLSPVTVILHSVATAKVWCLVLMSLTGDLPTWQWNKTAWFRVFWQQKASPNYLQSPLTSFENRHQQTESDSATVKDAKSGAAAAANLHCAISVVDHLKGMPSNPWRWTAIHGWLFSRRFVKTPPELQTTMGAVCVVISRVRLWIYMKFLKLGHQLEKPQCFCQGLMW